MKFVVFLFITQMIVIISSKPNSKLASNVTDCNIILPVKVNTQTIFFDIDHDSDELKTCILKNCHSEQSVILFNVYGTDLAIKVNATRRYVRRIITTDIPNVIIMTKHLTTNMVNSALIKFLIKSHWSLLYFIVTSDSQFKCKDDVMDQNDFIRLENIMNKLWQHFKIMKVGVVIPYTCPRKMVIYNGKRRSDKPLYDRPIKMINATNSNNIYGAIKNSAYRLADQYPVRGNIFLRYPTSMTDCEKMHYYVGFNLNVTNGHCGMDGMVMHDVLTHFKLKLSFPEDENCNKYGYATPGNASGSLGCIMRKELDISFNSRFMTLYSNESIYYLHYVTTDSLCALVKQSNVIPLWHGVFNVYRTPLWCLITVVIAAVSLFMWATALISKTMTGEKTMTFCFYFHDAMMTTMFGYSLRKTAKFLTLRCACLLASILFVAVYQSHINYVYTTLQHFDNIETLDQLYRSGTTLYTSPSMEKIMKLLQNPQNEAQLEFLRRIQLFPGNRLEFIQQHRDATTVDRKSDSMIEILTMYSDKSGRPLIHVVNECFSSFYLSYITRTGFPFFEDLQIFIERLKEAGLPTMYYKWTQRMLGLQDSLINLRSEPRPFSKIRFEDQKVAFGILVFGHVGSIIVFIAEIWRARRHRHLFSI